MEKTEWHLRQFNSTPDRSGSGRHERGGALVDVAKAKAAAAKPRTDVTIRFIDTYAGFEGESDLLFDLYKTVVEKSEGTMIVGPYFER